MTPNADPTRPDVAGGQSALSTERTQDNRRPTRTRATVLGGPRSTFPLLILALVADVIGGVAGSVLGAPWWVFAVLLLATLSAGAAWWWRDARYVSCSPAVSYDPVHTSPIRQEMS